MRVRMLANVVGHEGVLSEGAVVDCLDPRVGDWIERGLAESVEAVAEEPSAPREEPPALAPTLPAPPEPAAEEPPQEPPAKRRRGH